MKLNAKQLRDACAEEIKTQSALMERRPLYFILENIYDTYNVGGLFRLADALAVSKIYLCGDTEIPPNHKIVKASVGTYKVVPWEYKKTAVEAIKEVRSLQFVVRSKNEISDKVTVVAVEQDENSVPYNEVEYQMPLALLLGNETFGVLPETLKAVDQIVEIPMFGINKSLNVIVSAAVVSYRVVSG